MVLDVDNVWFILFIFNVQLVYFDVVYVSKMEWKKLLVDLMFILVFLIGMSVCIVSVKVVVNFGWDKV